MWEVLVGNVGRAFEGKEREARKTYNDYVRISKSGCGRAGDESVILMHDNEIVREYVNKFRTTVDLLTGKPFRWNETVRIELNDGSKVIVPARYTSRVAIYLHPSRVPKQLLAALNSEGEINA